MPDTTLSTICELQGVYHGCIYHQQAIIASSFPQGQSAGLLSALTMIEQVFDASHSIEKNHDEMYLLQDGSMLAAYRINDNCIILLLTDIKLNMPLTHLRVKLLMGKWLETAGSKIKPPPVAPAIRATPVISPSAPEPESPIVPAPTASTATPQDAATLQKVEALQKLLIHYLGPAANWVFSDVQAIWQQRHGATLTNLPQLVELLLPEFDMETDRIGFQQQAKHIINP